MCFVQTTELDGERNLKPVIASKYLNIYFDRIFKEKEMVIKAEFEHPSKFMYSYEGRILLTRTDPKDETKLKEKIINVDIKMFLYRGAVLRNSGTVFGLVT